MSLKKKSIAYFLSLNLLGPQIASLQQETLNWTLATQKGIRSSLATRWGYYPPSEAKPIALEGQPTTYRDLVIFEARKQHVNPRLALAVMLHESTENPVAISKAGALGLMQVMAANAPMCGLTPLQLLDPNSNIPCGVKILGAALEASKGDVRLALRIYNGGAKNLKKNYPENVKYPDLVLAKYYSQELGAS